MSFGRIVKRRHFAPQQDASAAAPWNNENFWIHL